MRTNSNKYQKIAKRIRETCETLTPCLSCELCRYELGHARLSPGDGVLRVHFHLVALQWVQAFQSDRNDSFTVRVDSHALQVWGTATARDCVEGRASKTTRLFDRLRPFQCDVRVAHNGLRLPSKQQEVFDLCSRTF